MAQASNEHLARSLIDSVRREVVWPVVFAGVKNIVRSNNFNLDTLTCVKGWLKSNDAQLHLPLLSLTVLHTISLNCSTLVRNQFATPKLFSRIEKQLARPQGPQVATAIVQVLVDWAHLFSQEELGARSRAVLAQSRISPLAAGAAPSPAVVSMQEELRLGLPAVAPIRGEDFIRWLYRGTSMEGATRPQSGPNSSGAGGASSVNGGATGGGGGFFNGGVTNGQLTGLPGGAPPPITTQAVPHLCGRMRADAQRLTAALAVCRTAARSQRLSELGPAMDAGYREAERCSQWRRRVQEYTQQCDDALGLSAVLAATDVTNHALQNWQHLTGREVYDTMRIVVPPMLAGMRAAAAASSGGARGRGGGGEQRAGQGYDIADLLGMGSGVPLPPHSPVTQPYANQAPPPGALPVPSHNPFAMAVASSTPQSASSSPHANGPAAASGGAPSRMAGSTTTASTSTLTAHVAGKGPPLPSHQSHPSLSDWDPFGPSPPAGGLGGAGGVGGWTVFDVGAAAAADVSASAAPYSPGVSSSQRSVMVPSPTTSVTSVSSTPHAATGGGGGGVSRGGGGGTPSPSYSRSAGEPFHDLLIEPLRTVTPQSSTTTTAATTTTRSTSIPLGSNGTGASSPMRPRVASDSAPHTTTTTSSAFNPEPQSNNDTRPAQQPTVLQPTSNAPAATSATPHVQSSLSAPHSSTQPTAVRTASGETCGGAATPASPSAASGFPALDWRPEFQRLATDLRSLLLTSDSNSASLSAAAVLPSGPGGGSSGGGAVLPAVLSRVQALCEALATQHTQQMAALQAQHVAEVKDGALAKALLPKVENEATSGGVGAAVAAGVAGTAGAGAGVHGSGASGAEGHAFAVGGSGMSTGASGFREAGWAVCAGGVGAGAQTSLI